MEYLAIHLNNKAVVRRADYGITDIEWKHGCRSIQINYRQKLMSEGYVKHLGYEVLSDDAWREFISSFDDLVDVPNNNFISTRVVYDKWDTKPTIY
jgi:hypothetical protein